MLIYVFFEYQQAIKNRFGGNDHGNRHLKFTISNARISMTISY